MEQPLSTDKPRKTDWLRHLLAKLGDNPVITKELKGRMRGKRAFIIMTSYLFFLSLVVSIIYGVVAFEMENYSWTPEARQGVGKAIFGTVVMLELVMIIFIGPGLTSGGISSEKERQTFDLLRTTLLPARSLVFGKLGSAMSYLLLLIIAALPIEGIAFILGGVGIGELLISSWMMIVTAFFFCSLGLFFSSFMKRTLGATVSSYITILGSTILLGLGIMIMQFLSYDINLSPFQEIFFDVVLWLFLSSNPLIAAGLSEAILIDDQSYFLVHNWGVYSSMTVPSPWIVFSLLYLGFGVIMLVFSIRFVKKPRKQ